MKIISCFWILLISLPLVAQEDWKGLKYENHIYKENIRTVKLYTKRGTGFGKPVQFYEFEQELHEPYMQLKSLERLYLYFDDMDYDAKDYSYTIIHCDANWKPSNLAELDYISGSPDNDIEEYNYSVNEVPGFTHYALQFPNEDMDILLSGNYLLVVYEDGDKEDIVLTRRFLVYDNKFPIAPNLRRPFDTAKMNTSHEFEFFVSHKRTEIRNPLKEIKATVLQNGRWDNAVTNLSPKFVRPERLDFDYVDKIVFDAGNEFRLLDLRSLDFLKNKVSNNNGQKEVWLSTDRDRSTQTHLTTADLNGKYVVVNNDDFRFNNNEESTAFRNGDYNFSNARQISDFNQLQDQENIDATYANVHFSVQCPFELYEKKVYLFGEFTDWKIAPEYELSYNEEEEMYEGEALVKQGVYDYAYVVVPKEGGQPDFSEFEGNRFETVNRYTFIVYYRPFGQQYDAIIGINEYLNNGF